MAWRRKPSSNQREGLKMVESWEELYRKYGVKQPSKKYFFIFLIMILAIIVGYLVSAWYLSLPNFSQNVSETFLSKYTECQRCPDFCRDKDGNKIDDLNESGSCICIKENEKCVRKINQIIYTASEIKPENFLGPYVSKEAYSNWMNYTLIKEKVTELTRGLNTDIEKAKAIATWVKNSRSYSPEAIGKNVFPFEEGLKFSKANAGGTIIDIFNANQGICMDAAHLLAAMLRLAGIPAMSVQPSSEKIMHQVTYAYINGKWLQVDATFGLGDPSVGIVVAQVPEFYEYKDIEGGIFDISFTSSYLCSEPYSEETAAGSFNYYLDHPVTLNKYGYTCLPFFYKYSQNWLKGYLSPSSSDEQYHFLFQPGLGISDSHYNLKLYWKEYTPEQKLCGGWTRTYFSDYLFCLQMPIGKYNVTYRVEHGIVREGITVATLKFEIKENTETILTENYFSKHPEATEEEYNLFIKNVKKILSYKK